MATAEKKPNPARIVTGKVRLSYTYLREPDQDDFGNLNYRAMVLIPKADKLTLKKMQRAVQAATLKFTKGDKAKAAKFLKHPKWHKPLRDPEAEDLSGEQYEGMYFLSAKSRDRPGLLLKSGVRVDTSEMIDQHFYSGVYVNCSLSFYPFDTKGNKGVAVALNNIIKHSDGDRLDGRASAEDELSEYIDESDTSGMEEDMDFDEDFDDDPPPKKSKKGKKGKKSKPVDEESDDDFDLDL